jgi:hypothetical protein
MKDLSFSSRQIWYVVKRTKAEGLRFVTSTLANLSKHILLCIENGRWTPLKFGGKSSPLKTKGAERYTWFIHDELSSIFSGDGDCAYNLMRVRQLCEYFYKLALPAGPEAQKSAEEDFLQTDLSLSFDRSFAEQVRVVAENHLRGFKALTLDQVLKESRYGPGTFSGYQSYNGSTLQEKKDNLDGCFPEGKKAYSGFYRSRKTSITSSLYLPKGGYRLVVNPETIRLSELIGTSAFVFNTWRYECKKRLTQYSPQCTTSEVLFVPKNADTERVIVREPAHNIYAQMGFHNSARRAIQRDTGGCVQFDSQERFRDLAESSSVTREYATLDLSKASDSVSLGLALTVFRNFPSFIGMVRHFRTSQCTLPSGRVHNLRKLAGMGSGFTFPIMAAIIYCTVLACINTRDRKQYQQRIFVFGDDIIVPTEIAKQASQALRRVGLTVNVSKSYVDSYFRESCGGDYFHGQAVAPVRLKQLFCKMRSRNATVISSNHDRDKFILKLERHCRELIENGLLNLASYYYDRIESWLNAPLPVGRNREAFPLIRYSLRDPVNYNEELADVSVHIPCSTKHPTCKAGFDRSFANHLLSITEEASIDKPADLFLDTKRYDVELKQSVSKNLTILS